MKITGFRSLTASHDWGRPVGDANGHSDGSPTAVHVLIVDTDSELTGIGIGPHPNADTIFPTIDGQDPRSVTALYDAMLRSVFKAGHAGAVYGTIGVFDTALWDLKAKIAGEPLWRLLGGRDRFVTGYASGLDIALTHDQLTALYTTYADHGFRAAKLKGGLDVEADLDRLHLIGDLLRTNTRSPGLMLDANESWHPSQAVRYLHRLEDQLDLAWIEEPVGRWDADGLAHVRSHVRAAVATGENLSGLGQLLPLLERGAVDIVQPGTAWGITSALRMSTAAHAHHLLVSPVAHFGNALAHLMTATPNHLATEVQDLHFPTGLTADHHFSDGGIVLGDSPGLGITVDPAAIVPPHGGGWTTVNGPHIRPEHAGRRLVLE